VNVGAEAARRFLVARHFLAPARSLAGGPDAVREVVRRLGSLQYDPIAVAGRSHDLVLHARVADYEAAWCDELYERRVLFEAYNKGLSFVPAAEYPWFRALLRPDRAIAPREAAGAPAVARGADAAQAPVAVSRARPARPERRRRRLLRARRGEAGSPLARLPRP
jgi:uncharacterized protein YcaQ